VQRDDETPGRGESATRGLPILPEVSGTPAAAVAISPGAFARYAAVWRLPGAPTLLVTATIGRLGLGITSLALILHVAGVVGRYTPAAVAAACYALANAATGPVVGRLADRFGPAPVLRATAVAHPAALALLLAAARGDHPSLWLIWGTSALAGATFPPMSAAVRGAWNALTTAEAGRAVLRTPALAAEATLVEVIFVAGPLLVAVFVAVASPAAALVAAAVVTLVGTWLVAGSPSMVRSAPTAAHERTRGLGPLRVSGFPTLVGCVGALGLAFGSAGLAVPAFADRHAGASADSVAGILLAVWGVGSATGGLLFGTRPPGASLARQLGWLLAAVGASLAVLAVVPTPALMAVVLIVGGAAIAPAMIVTNTLVGRITPVAMHTEAYTWVLTVSAAAGALGGAVSGLLIDHVGVPWAFVFCALAVALAAVAAGRPGSSIAAAAP
jgi:MFS family permease